MSELPHEGQRDDRPTLPLPAGAVVVEIAAGELIDKLTILEIKAARIRDPQKLSNVRTELAVIQAAYARSIDPSERLNALIDELKLVNLALWELEDEIRACDHAGEFSARFVAAARQVYVQNDRRAALKRRINELLGSRFAEEKSYGDG